MISHDEVVSIVEGMIGELRDMPDSTYFYGVLEGCLYAFRETGALTDEEYEILFDKANDVFTGNVEKEVAQLSSRSQIVSEQQIDGIHLNPVLPEGMTGTPNDQRPGSHNVWINRPYIETTTMAQLETYWREQQQQSDDEIEQSRQKWLAAYPEGTCYTVHCLDGEVWDRPTEWGYFQTLDEAVACIKARLDAG